MRRFPDPKRWLFNEDDRMKYKDRYWRCPVRLVKNETWAKLWRTPGTIRGGGAITSVLPVLALHTWPEKEGAIATWTGPTYLSQRRIARLAGVNKETVAAAIKQLVSYKLMDVKKRPRAKREGGYKIDYRLNIALYPKGDEPYAQLPAAFFYGGTWFMLPSAASRHMYVVIVCLDPIRNEDAYLDKLKEAGHGDLDWLVDEEGYEIEDDQEREAVIEAKVLAKRRSSEPQSISDLVRFSGLQRSTVVEALRVLTTPIFVGREINGVKYPPISLVLKGEAPPRTPTWYAPNRRARDWYWHWPPGFLNSADVSEVRDLLWPFFMVHADRARRRQEEE
jgi:hypothetical protein